MSEPITKSLQVISIRKRKPTGVAFGAYALTSDGLLDRRKLFGVGARGKQYKDIQVGETWLVTGIPENHSYSVKGFMRHETRIESKDLSFQKPSGEQIVGWITDNKKINGIGDTKANKLWLALGNDLYRALDESDSNTLLKVISSETLINNLIEVWQEEGDTKTIQWMQDHRIPLPLSRKLIRFHGRNTLSALTEDPYCLLSFCEKWEDVDNLACSKMGVTKDDPRRLQAAVEQVLYNQMTKGHTCLNIEKLRVPLRKLLTSSELASNAIDQAHLNKVIMKRGDTLQLAGNWIMERTVAKFVTEAVINQHQVPIYFDCPPEEMIDQFEKEEAETLGIDEFKLNPAQSTAIIRSFENKFSIITGGAGVGKTTVLKALYRLLDTYGSQRFQMALSGRAAKRMNETTQEHSSTIASFLQNTNSKSMGNCPIIVIDEASMVDLASMYRIIKKLPEQCHMVLVGDPYQLPPVAAGLVLHCMMNVDYIPVSELTEVKRQAKDSSIPLLAASVRKGVWPTKMLKQDTSDHIKLISCPKEEIVKTVVSLYDESPENTQILSPTNANSFSGCNVINRQCVMNYTGGKCSKQLKLYGEPTGFFEGDTLLYTKNDWARDLQNGTLGKLIEAFEEPKTITIKTGEKSIEVTAIGLADWEGRVMPILEHDVEALLHGFAVTIHKSQGSQFNRVIIPLSQSRNGFIDRTLIYTAITRAVDQVILVGDINVAEQAVIAPPSATLRNVALPDMLEYYKHIH